MSETQKDDIIIKKYANRRLYDTLTSSYVTLEDLCDMVKRGVNFKVIDAKTEEDLTRSVLTQIIFDQESKGYNVLPISFLRNVIGFYDDNLSAVLPSYLDGMMDHFHKNQDEMRSYMNKNNNESKDFSPFQPFEEIQKQNMQVFEKTMNMFNPFAGSADKSDDSNS